MRKVIFTLAVAFGMIAAANAQLVVGGSLEFGGNASSSNIDKGYGDLEKRSNFNLGFIPRIGYITNEKWEIGAGLELAYDQDNYWMQVPNNDDEFNPNFKFEKDSKTPKFTWAVQPYVRYRCLEYKGLGLWIEGVLSVGTGKGSTKYFAYGTAPEGSGALARLDDDDWGYGDGDDYGDGDGYDDWGDGWEEDWGYDWRNDYYRSEEDAEARNDNKCKAFNGSLYIQPVLTYTIKDHWMISAELQLLSLGISGSVEKNIESGVTATNKYLDWDLGVLQGRGISIGVAYKF